MDGSSDIPCCPKGSEPRRRVLWSEPRWEDEAQGKKEHLRGQVTGTSVRLHSKRYGGH
jgi:hypothetical protein